VRAGAVTKRAPAGVALLLFGSGFCALVYQTAWLRQFRLIFGASTAATAAVLAIFMGGLGIGSALLGRRADRHPLPLRFYGNLELLIAASAALSPALLWLVAKIYFAMGGSISLGTAGATLVRLLLSLIVLGIPTVLMGGTLPAAARAVETSEDQGRRKLALLYAANTLGAVTGTLVSTFYMLEVFGNRKTLFLAVVINVVVALVARAMTGPALPDQPVAQEAVARVASRPAIPILGAAAATGFAFLLMELVWYRMLAPLLGGSTFTFGLILAVALLGIGLGGGAYALLAGDRRATAGGFALTCSLEALFIALPFALGDRLAMYAGLLRELGALGFGGHVISWTILTLVVVFPAAFLSGVQFPLLIALLGGGGEEVGDHVGRAYAWNTAGAIAGSLAGGFGLLPLLSAPDAWRAVIIIVTLLAGAAIAAALRARQRTSALASACVCGLAIALACALGPTSVWRHSGIGAGRADKPASPNGAREWMNGTRRMLLWDVDGRESSVALVDSSDFAFIVNGKADGSARGDAGTQVMAGMVGAALHSDPRRALVIGLGTGSTAGWLGAVESMQRVDVVELEPAVLRVARACASVNHDVLHNAKVHLHIADAREILLASRDRYDIIFSEPSNPYRAGIASLFTEEFYRASEARLAPKGIFLQWVQAYDVDAQTIRTIYATLGSVFANVETWQTDSGDLLLVASREPIAYDATTLRRRLAQPAFLGAMSGAWRVQSLEGFLAHFVGRASLARAIARQEQDRNTDDRTLVEFGFARGLGSASRFGMDELVAASRARGEDRPDISRGNVTWNLVAANRATINYVNALVDKASPEDLARHRAALSYEAGRLDQSLAEWRARPWPAVNGGELVMIAESLAEAGSEAGASYAEQLRHWYPVDADLILARVRFRQRRFPEAAEALHRGFVTARSNPWGTAGVMGRSLDIARQLAAMRPYVPLMADALARPFAAGQWDDVRKFYLVLILRDAESCSPRTLHAMQALEPWVPWKRDYLVARRDCYASVMLDELAARAGRELAEYDASDRVPLLEPAAR
jgi:spermidine synthase